MLAAQTMVSLVTDEQTDVNSLLDWWVPPSSGEDCLHVLPALC